MGLKETEGHLIRHKEILDTKGIKELYNLKEIPAFCIDHINLEYKHQKINIQTLDILIEEKHEIDDLLLIKIPSNHSDDNLAILDKKTNILFVGDALCGKIIEYDFIKDKETISAQIKFLEALEFDTIIESHSNPKTKEEILNKLNEKINSL